MTFISCSPDIYDRGRGGCVVVQIINDCKDHVCRLDRSPCMATVVTPSPLGPGTGLCSVVGLAVRGGGGVIIPEVPTSPRPNSSSSDRRCSSTMDLIGITVSS